MPELPFTFEDLRNFDMADHAEKQRFAKESKPDMSMSSPMDHAQKFLKGKLSDLKGHMGSAKGFIDVGLAMNPITRAVDIGSKFFGGPGIQEGFHDGVSYTGEVRVDPRGPF